MDVRSGRGSFRSRDRRLERARRIPAGDIALSNVLKVTDPDGFELVVADFTVHSQSNPLAVYQGQLQFNGELVEEGLLCSCPDFSNGFLCKHAIAALLKAGCPEEYFA